MKVRLKYFGNIAEMVGASEEVLELNEGANTELLCKLLEERLPHLATSNYRLALNQSIANENVELNESDELALLPPFAGG